MKRLVSVFLCLLFTVALGGCSNRDSSSQKDLTADMFSLSQKMMQADETLPIMMTYTDKDDENGSKLRRHFGLNRTKTNAYFFSCEESENTHEISVLEMKSSQDTPAAEEALKKHAESLSKQFSDSKEKKARVDKAIVTSKGRYTALIICDKPSEVQKAFDAAIQ